MRRVPNSTIAHVSASPLLIPDGRISRVRLAAVATFPEESSHYCPRLKHSPAYTPELSGYILSSTASEVSLISGTVSGSVSYGCPLLTESPFAYQMALPSSRTISRTVSAGVTQPSLLILAHAPDHNPPTDFGFPTSADPCRLLRAPAGRWPFPTLSLRSLYRCLGPYPATALRCSCPFLPGSHRPHLTTKKFGP